MRVQEVVTIPNPILRQKAQKVANFDIELLNLSTKMIELMRQYDGVGLAAPQMGISQRMIVIEYNPREKEKNTDKPFPLTILINPAITRFSNEKVVMVEGCLSLPGLEMEVKKPKEVNVIAQDLNGKNIKIRAKGLLARVLQHEINHLDGILFTDLVKDVKNIKHYIDLRCVFMGTPEFAVPTLEALIVNNVNLVGVITETDKPVGRKQEITAPVVKKVAEEFGLPVFQSSSRGEIEEIIEKLQPDYIIVAAYGKILSQKILSVPDYGILNIHPSMLPKYRGGTPIQSAILNGDDRTGITIMKLNENMDEGDIISQKIFTIENTDTTESLSSRLAIEGAKFLIETLPLYLSNRIKPKPQEGEPTYTKIIQKEDGEIDWKMPIEDIERMIRAYNPWPHAYTFLDNKRLIIHQAHIKDGKLMPDVVQTEGKNPTNWEDFKRGFRGDLPEKLR